jgi:hypothetical protein
MAIEGTFTPTRSASSSEPPYDLGHAAVSTWFNTGADASA